MDVTATIINPAEGSRGFSFDELVSREIPATKWVCTGIPEGTSILGGGVKHGKSGLMEYAACQVAESQPVAFFALEYNELVLTQRLKKLTGNGLNPQHAVFWHGYQVTDSELEPLAFVEAKVREVQPYLTVVDTLGRVKPMTRGSYQEEYHAATLLKQMADSAGTNLVVIHHTRKRNADADTDPREDLLGSQGIGAAFDNILIFDRPDGAARLRGFGRLIEDFEVFFRYESGIYTPIDAAEVAKEVLENQFPTGHAVAFLLQDGSTYTIKELEQRINQGLDKNQPTYMSRQHIYGVLKRFREQGLVEGPKRKGGPWRWTGPTTEPM